MYLNAKLVRNWYVDGTKFVFEILCDGYLY